MLKYVNQIDYIKLIELTTKQLFMAIYMEFNIYIFDQAKEAEKNIVWIYLCEMISSRILRRELLMIYLAWYVTTCSISVISNMHSSLTVWKIQI